MPSQLRFPIASLICVLLLAFPASALAYVGPGSGLTVIGAALAFLGSLFLAIVGFIWYPLKRWLRGRNRKAAGAETSEGSRPMQRAR